MLTAKHKTSQLIQVNKIPFQAKQKVVSVYKDRLKSKGYGETSPDAPNQKANGSDDPIGRQLNRRVELKIIGVK